MLPGDPACRELTPEEAAELARGRTSSKTTRGTAERPARPASVHAGTLPARGSSATRTRIEPRPRRCAPPSERWYGYVKCIGTHEVNPC